MANLMGAFSSLVWQGLVTPPPTHPQKCQDCGPPGAHSALSRPCEQLGPHPKHREERQDSAFFRGNKLY